MKSLHLVKGSQMKQQALMLHSIQRRLENFLLMDYSLGDLGDLLSCCATTLGYTKAVPRPKFDTVEQSCPLRAIVISLPHRSDRRRWISSHLTHMNVKYGYLDAVHGRTQREFPTRVFTRRSLERLSSGSLGCVLSHMHAWGDVASGADELVLILEDDAMLAPQFAPRLSAVLDSVREDFDLLMLGYRDSLVANIRRCVAPGVFEPRRLRRGLHAYVLSREGATRLLQTAFPIDLAYGGVDTVVGKLLRKRLVRGLMCVPALSEVNRSLPSSIFNPLDPSKLLHHSELPS